MARSTTTVGAYDAKTRFSQLLERVENGQEITITRHGTPVAKLVPVARKSTEAERAAAIERMLDRRKRLSLGGLTIRQLREEGRR